MLRRIFDNGHGCISCIPRLTKKAGSFFSCHFIFMMFSSDHIYQMHPAFFQSLIFLFQLLNPLMHPMAMFQMGFFPCPPPWPCPPNIMKIIMSGHARNSKAFNHSICTSPFFASIVKFSCAENVEIFEERPLFTFCSQPLISFIKAHEYAYFLQIYDLYYL